MSTSPKSVPFYDVIVVGAGLSGIGAGYHLQNECPDKSFAILESRASMGGTWDLFKYPGIRSDSDMYTLGFPFNPWKSDKTLADGPAILQYIKDTAAKFGIDKKIQYHHKVIDASWSDAEKRWTITLAPNDQVPYTLLQCRFLTMCSGYYDYKSGYLPEFAGKDTFEGQIIHPQQWTTDVDYANKKVIVIGSGATAVTLVPELAKKATHVTMLQRTPTYIAAVPGTDKIASALKKVLPEKLAYSMIRWKNIMLAIGVFNFSKRWPQTMRRLIQKGAEKSIGNAYEQKHFDPPYNPWDQRMCLIPDADLFSAIREGSANIVTDQIERFTPKGILLKSGAQLDADLIVTATGLKVQLLGGMTMHRNGSLVDPGKTHAYRGVMFSDIPNFAFTVGYTNASWTLKCDLSLQFVTKVLRYMAAHNHDVVTPRFDSEAFTSEPLLDFSAGYVLRAADMLPKQGSKHPWKVYQNYVRDLMSLKWSGVNDKYLEYR
jgi:cation diffusion facilitator CzcD-associated flavoprotein CzcO